MHRARRAPRPAAHLELEGDEGLDVQQVCELQQAGGAGPLVHSNVQQQRGRQVNLLLLLVAPKVVAQGTLRQAVGGAVGGSRQRRRVNCAGDACTPFLLRNMCTFLLTSSVLHASRATHEIGCHAQRSRSRTGAISHM